MLKLNPATGQYEDDGQPAIDPSLGTMSAPLAAAASTPPPTPGAPIAPVLPAAPAPVKPVKATPGAGASSELNKELSEGQATAAERQSANEEMTAAAATTAQNKADAAEQAATELKAQQESAATKEAAAKTEYDRLQGISAAEDAKYKNANFRDYWADKSTGTKVLATISMALGALGQGLAAAGGSSIPNTALQLINSAIERDWAVQKGQMEKQKDIADASRSNAHDARLAWDAAQASTFARQKEAIAAATEKAALANGSPEARAKGAVIAGQLRQEAQEQRQVAMQKNAQLGVMRSETAKNYAEAGKANAEAAAGGKSGKVSSAEEGAASDAANIVTNLEQIGKLPQLTQKDLATISKNKALISATAEPKSLVGAGLAIAGREAGAVPYSDTKGLSGPAQQAYLAWQNVRSSMAHVLTGAGMSDREREDYIRRYTPQPGDDDTTVKAKFISAKKFVQDSLLKAGNAAAPVQQRLQALPEPGARPQLSPVERTRLIDFVRKNPNAPQAAQARALLGV